MHFKCFFQIFQGGVHLDPPRIAVCQWHVLILIGIPLCHQLMFAGICITEDLGKFLCHLSQIPLDFSLPGQRLMRSGRMLPSFMVFLGVTVEVDLGSWERVHGWWRQGHVSPTCPI